MPDFDLPNVFLAMSEDYANEAYSAPTNQDSKCCWCPEDATHLDQDGRPRCTWCKWDHRIFHPHSPWSWLRWYSPEVFT